MVLVVVVVVVRCRGEKEAARKMDRPLWRCKHRRGRNGILSCLYSSPVILAICSLQRSSCPPLTIHAYSFPYHPLLFFPLVLLFFLYFLLSLTFILPFVLLSTFSSFPCHSLSFFSLFLNSPFSYFPLRFSFLSLAHLSYASFCLVLSYFPLPSTFILPSCPQLSILLLSTQIFFSMLLNLFLSPCSPFICFLLPCTLIFLLHDFTSYSFFSRLQVSFFLLPLDSYHSFCPVLPSFTCAL